MQLSPLQSRLAASLAASLVLLALYFLLLSPTFAMAAELSFEVGSGAFLEARGEDIPLATWLERRNDLGEEDEEEVAGRLEARYEPEFGAFDRSIVGRAPAGVFALANNMPQRLNVEAGTTAFFTFEESQIFGRRRRRDAEEVHNTDDAGREFAAGEKDDHGEGPLHDETELRRRQRSSRTIYITANTCMQPERVVSSGSTSTIMPPPQLTLFVSTSQDNQTPGRKPDAADQVFRVFEEGAVSFQLNTTGTVFFGVAGPPDLNDALFSGVYNFEIAASTDEPYHGYDNSTDRLMLMDSDSSAALLVTRNLTDSADYGVVQSIMAQAPPYVMFAAGVDDTAVMGVWHSYCGLQTYAQIAATKGGKFTNMVTTSMTTRGPGSLPKQQFYFSGLNASSWYSGILAIAPKGQASQKRQADGEVTGGGGGRVFAPTQFQTKEGNNCKIITSLEFCNETTYAVPSNEGSFANATDLARVYDNYARRMYANFEKVLAQIQCEATNSSRYSLVRTCADCERAYKRWLCAVTIPKCEDITGFNSPNLTEIERTNIIPRNLNASFPEGAASEAALAAAQAAKADPLFQDGAYQRSRNPVIDSVIAPGPYMEVLPCESLCFELVQSCPAQIGFGCPQKGVVGYNTSYAKGVPGTDCNYPGVPQVISRGEALGASWGLAAGAVMIVLALVT